ncbi:MAG: indolepyruvate ferredoxin oxidoreductase subunit alpha [Clostridia bacterium]|nr:indolepyruvate ferredoxin oxidoreductase subunit alpha [Clostridia bacterium]
MKQLMLGNAAVARGTWEAGVRFASSYPGTPSTEITECISRFDDIYSEWAPNEKVAVEAAIGASLAGARAFSAMKHVGLNVAADPLFTVSYIGVNGGLVIAVADDPGMHSSQNEQDSRHYAQAAKLPMLEPADSGECLAFTKAAYELSERFDTPVLLRLTTRISHSQSAVEESDRFEAGVKDYVKDPAKNVMIPAHARPRHVLVEKRMAELAAYAEDCPFNRVEMGGKIGVICAGDTYQYAKEALGDGASYLKLGLVNPLPVNLIKDFCARFEKVYVLEEMDPVIETFCRANGLNVEGKALFSLCGEYSPELIASVLLGETAEGITSSLQAPGRPPVLCPGCPHRGVYFVLKKLKLTVSGDIGCYTLGVAAPLSALDTTVCMGASVSALHGFNKVRPESAQKSVAVIGDSTFMHSGITGLTDIVYNNGHSTVIILDNSITGMTGHQQNPTTGLTIKNQPAGKVDLIKLCEGIGVPSENIRVVHSYDLKGMEAALKEELAKEAPSVIIAQMPCALLKTVKHAPALRTDPDKCTGCKACFRIGCPAVTLNQNGKCEIDASLCVGCGLCSQICKFGAIGGAHNA